ncbi:bifunctional lytic transglycosylase/C40 family peptidase [Frankia sp. AgPm24]|uniref:C40 family peptidase n=1 Tax=Frankia sp. AgPm24 TaxID=631128 RepID=UPI00200ED500|nr:bifunctional lytic transglycosylase/C40 family peptidase [Frankia sp. AgPm24]MCK9921219.1 bifunctional lytic transglycosylase/C40 family peptidase [Frankia sp. AgPm24]
MKIALAVAAGFLALVILLAAAATGVISILTGGRLAAPSQTALDDIPDGYQQLYVDAAATCPGLPWPVLAAIGKIETDHGRSTLPGVQNGVNEAGAEGPMQFLPATFASVIARHPPPPGGAQPPSPYNPHDAIYTAAAYLCDSNAASNLHDALYQYNHAEWYVSDVLAQADRYTAADEDTGPSTAGTPQSPLPPGQAVVVAVAYAVAHLGFPYQWGGDGPDSGDSGFDCSGLTQAAFAAAGVSLPRVAQDQYNTGPHLPAGSPLQTGDLVFFGSSTSAISHVGIYVGDSQMIDAPNKNSLVRVEDYRWSDYRGATRPIHSP